MEFHLTCLAIAYLYCSEGVREREREALGLLVRVNWDPVGEKEGVRGKLRFDFQMFNLNNKII